MNITVYNLSIGQCVVLKLPKWYDFLVYLSDGEYAWRGCCLRRDLQSCIEAGFAAYKKLKPPLSVSIGVPESPVEAR